MNGPTYKITVGRTDLTVMAMGAEITTAMGLNSWAAFAGDRDRAHIAGDIAMLEPEVNPVSGRCAGTIWRSWRCTTTCSARSRASSSCTTTAPARPRRWRGGFRAALDELGKHGRSMRMSGHS